MPTGVYLRTKYHREITRKAIKNAYQGGIKMGFQKNHVVNFGRICSEKTRMKIGKTRLNENNPSWKGNGVKYTALHQWVNRKLGKVTECNYCGTRKAKRFEWHSVSERYLRKLVDWMGLCKSCHLKVHVYRSIKL